MKKLYILPKNLRTFWEKFTKQLNDSLGETLEVKSLLIK